MIFGAKYKKNAYISILIILGVSIGIEALSLMNGSVINNATKTILAGIIIPFLFNGKILKWLGLYFPIFGIPTTVASIVNTWIDSINTISQKSMLDYYSTRFLNVFVMCGLLYFVYKTRKNTHGIELN